MDGTVSRKLMVALALVGMVLSLSLVGCGPTAHNEAPNTANTAHVVHFSAYGHVATVFATCHAGNLVYATTKGGVAVVPNACAEVGRERIKGECAGE